jgi:hypothetical protein
MELRDGVPRRKTGRDELDFAKQMGDVEALSFRLAVQDDGTAAKKTHGLTKRDVKIKREGALKLGELFSVGALFDRMKLGRRGIACVARDGAVPSREQLRIDMD